MRHSGGCHCGNIRMVFESAIDPAEIPVRACQCTFCRKHGTRAIADPDGVLTLTIADPARLNRYRFGLQTADYLLCRDCGVYTAAVTLDDEPRAIAMVNALDDHRQFAQAPMAMDYDAESQEVRIQRRRQRWMPVVVELT